jgi:hypothetical protein
MNVGSVNALRGSLAAQLGSLDHLTSELSHTATAAANPQAYGVNTGETTVAPWSLTHVVAAKNELLAARAAANDLILRLTGEMEAQTRASGNTSAAVKSVSRTVSSGGAGSGGPLSDDELIRYLAGLTPAELAAVFANNPELEARLRAMSASEIAALWSALDDAQEQALIDTIPTVVGLLEGADYEDRDRANQDVLDAVILRNDRAIAEMDAAMESGTAQDMADLTEKYGMSYVDLVAQQKSAEAIRDALDKAPDEGPIRQLVSFDLRNGTAVAAISVGNLDTADNATMLVPGIQTTVEENMSGWTKTAQNLYNEQAKIANQYDMLGEDGEPLTVAVVAWLGYDTPGMPPFDPGVWNDDAAREGGADLALALDGVSAARDWGTNDERLDVVGLSYGSTTAAAALELTSAGTFVALGSPGVPGSVVDATYLDVAKGQVWATEAVKDNVADMGRWSGRQDPTSLDFGAQVFGSDGSDEYKGTNTHGGAVHTKGDQNYGYLDSRTESIHNVGLITLGLPPTLPAPLPTPTPTPGPAPTPPPGTGGQR